MKWIAYLLVLVFSTPSFSQLAPGELPQRQRRRSPIESEIFRGDWWDYYNRAIRSMNAGDLASAETDLREAIKYHPEGGLRVRTYGVRFQEYLPHLELGMILFSRGRYSEAIQSLQGSLKVAKLEETEFFLHEAYRQQALQSGSDQSPPQILIAQPLQGMVTNRTKVLIKGNATDDIFVDTLVVDNKPVLVPKARSETEFSVEVLLNKEINRIPIVVTDLVGRTSSQEVLVEVDRQGPVFSLRKLETASGTGRVRLVGTFYDKYGVSSISVGGESLSISPQKQIDIDQVVSMGQGDAPVRIISVDQFGNNTVSDIDPKTKVGKTHAIEDRVRVAGLGMKPGWVQSAPRRGPKIEMLGLHDEQKVYLEELYVDGLVTDSTEVQKIELNGETLDIPPGNHLYFSYLAGPLEVGSNTLEVKATNRAQDTSLKRVNIQCELPVIESMVEQLLAVVVPEFETEDERIDPMVLSSLREMIINEIDVRFRFRVVNDRQDLAVLKEQEFRASGLVDTRYSLQPDMVSADLVLDGIVKQVGQTLSLYVTVVNTSTGLTQTRVETHAPDTNEDSLRELAMGLVLKLEVKFPRIKGKVIEAEREVVAEINIPRNETREKRGMPAVAFHNGGELKLSTGRSTGIYWKEVGLLKITRPGNPVTILEWDKEFLQEPPFLMKNDLVVTK